MKYIKKSKQEPKSLVNWRTQEEKANRINYFRMKGDDIWGIFPSKSDKKNEKSYSKQELWDEYLVKEQGGICAYCGRRIKNYEDGKPRIEHLKPKSKENKLTLSYFNMVAVCQGDENPINLHCDAKKGSEDINTFPTHKSCEEKFIYKWDGKIKAKDNNELVIKDIENLGLNVAKLKIARNSIILKVDTFIEILKKERDEIGILQEIKKRINQLQNRQKNVFEEFCFVEVYYLRKKLGTI